MQITSCSSPKPPPTFRISIHKMGLTIIQTGGPFIVTTQLVARQCTRTLLEGVWLSDIGRMAEVRNVPHLACKV